MNHAAILETTQALGETTVIADAAQIVDFCRYLKDEERYFRLDTITAVDWHPAEPRFEVVYHLHGFEPEGPSGGITHTRRLRVKCRLSGAAPEIDSVSRVWRSANWYERETF